MSPAVISVFIFGLYMAGEAAILLIAPNVLFTLFGLPLTQEVWARVVGVALAVFAYYYIQAARQEMKPFFVITTHGRALQFVLFVGLVVAGIGQPMLMLFAGIELASGIWTWFALRHS
jgi:hypothetical protein